MNFNRRQLLMTAASLSLAACSGDIRLRSHRDLILGGGQYLAPGSQLAQYALSILELDQQQQQVIPLPFLPHGIHRNPQQNAQLALFEKIGPGACEFDMSSREVTRTIAALQGHQFYGHGAYSVDGSLLFATESSIETLAGTISVRDAKDLKVVGQFPSYGKSPHECKLIDQGQTMLVTNGGGTRGQEAPSVSYIDVKSQLLLEQVTLRNEHINAGHVAVSSDGELIVVSAPRAGLNQRLPGGVSIGVSQGQITPAKAASDLTNRLYGEALSVSIHDGLSLAAVTHPDGNMLTIWSLQDQRLIKTIRLPGPRGVELTNDQSAFIVSFGSEASVLKIPVTTLEPDNKSTHSGTFITGSHIYNWSSDMHELNHASGLRS